MKKITVTNYATLKHYCQQRAQEFEALREEFEDMYALVLHDKTLNDQHNKLQQKKKDLDKFMTELTTQAAQTLTPAQLAQYTKQSESLLNSGKRIHKAIKIHYTHWGAQDREAIQKLTTRVEARYKKFTEEWRGLVAQALSTKNYAAAAALVVTLPQYSGMVGVTRGRNSRYFSTSELLGRKNNEINAWVEETKKAIPRKIYLQEKINYLANLLPERYLRTAELARELAEFMEARARGPAAQRVLTYEENQEVEKLTKRLVSAEQTRERTVTTLRLTTNELNRLEKTAGPANSERA